MSCSKTRSRQTLHDKGGKIETGNVGKVYQDGETIIHQGDEGQCMYIIQEGWVEVVKSTDGREVRLAVRGAGEFFGEMALFEREARMASVRAKGTARILTIDKENFLRRIHEDPSLAYRMVQMMSHRIRQLSDKLARLENLLTEHEIPSERMGDNL